MKKAVMIIAQDDFRDEELLVPKKILEEAGVSVSVASRKLSEARGVRGARVMPDITLGDIDLREFDAVIFVGGGGSSTYWDDPLAHKIAQDTNSANKPLAAICIAPVIFARAGLLNARKATVWPSEAQELKLAGADYTAEPVERHANIITAAGPDAASNFANEILKALGE